MKVGGSGARLAPPTRGSAPRRDFFGGCGFMGAMGAVRYAGVVAVGVAAVVAIAGTGAPAQGADPGQTQPNVVVVMTDDQTAASLSMMPTVESELAAKGATFANNFTNWPLCCPSRSTFYTGQYAHNHGVLGNSAPDGGFTKFNDSNTLPLWLQQAGYHTIHIGKYLNGYGTGTSDPTYVPPGWNEWYAASGGSTQSVYDYQLNQNGSLVPYGTAETDFKQDVFSNLAVDAINRNAPGGPFFMGVMYTAPHSRRPEPEPEPADQLRRDREAGAAPRHRLRLRAAADAAELQRGRRLRQARGDPGDALDHRARRSRPSSASTAAGSSRCSRSTTASGGSSTRSAPAASSATR